MTDQTPPPERSPEPPSWIPPATPAWPGQDVPDQSAQPDRAVAPAPPPAPWQVPGATAPLPLLGPPVPGPQRESLGVDPRHRDRGRPSGWVWPAVAVLALVVGLAGGVGGSVLHEQLGEPDPVAGTVADGLAGVDTVALPPLEADDTSVAAVAQELLPSTVQILAEYDGEADGASGSGFVLDRQGHVITNNHVVADAASDDGPIEIVDQDGNLYDATIVGRSPVYDIAVLYVPEAEGLTPAALGSSEKLRVGEPVVALGSPLGLTSTVTAGIVSALGRPVSTGDSDDSASYINAVQTDAAINPGNSGGPLVNLLGQVVGVNSAIATNGGGEGNIGVGFAIPVEQVRTTADQILRSGEARYPVIGATIAGGSGRTVTGAVVSEVLPGSPAEAGGLRADDRITALDGERVANGSALIVAIRTHQPGETVTLSVTRGDDEREVEVQLDSEVG